MSFRTVSHPILLPILLLALAAPLAPPATAQDPTWETVSMEPSCSMVDVSVLPDGAHGWAVGRLSYGGARLSCVVRMTGGGAWERIPFAFEESALPNGVAFADATHGWIVGEGGVILATTNGGDTWTQQPSGTTRKLTKICMLDAQRGWITGGWQDGSSYLVLRTTNGGATWQNQSFGSGCYSNEDVFFTDANNGWIVGQDSGINPHIHRTTNGGTTWTRQTVPAGAGSPGGIDFVSANEGWVSTSSLYQVPPGAILHTTNGGATWTVQGYTNRHYNYCIDARDAQNIAIGSVQVLTPASEAIVVSHDGGMTWTEHVPPVVAYTHAIAYLGNTIRFACDYGRVLRSDDDGGSWAYDYHAPPWKSLAWSDHDNGWLVAGSSVGTDGYCFRSTDAGLSWAREYGAPGGSQVLFIGPQVGWMLTEGTGAAVHRTTDGGATWSRHVVGGGWIDGIAFPSSLRGYAYGSNGTMRVTTNGGVSWSAQSLSTTRFVETACFLNETEGWCGGGYGGSNGFVRHTTDGGANWAIQNPASSDHVVSIHFLDPQNGWALCYGGVVQRTTNGGANWTFASQIAGPYYAYEIRMKDLLHGWALVGNSFGGQIGEDGRGFIYTTTDGGGSWTRQWESPWAMGHLYDLVLQPGGDPWVCGHNTTLLRLVDPAGLDDPAALAQGHAPHWTIAPNPIGTGGAVIEYDIAEACPVAITVFDATGREMLALARGVQTAGTHAFHWDGGSLPPGIYFARIETSAGRSAKRIVVGP